MEQLLKPLLGPTHTLALHLRATAEVVRVDPMQFERIVVNLATNARDAMPQGGTLTIETVNPGSGAVHIPEVDASRVLLQVRDTGTGIDADTIDHIFEPFFTTKESGGGGLGLAIVHGLVQQYSGSIGVESTPGRGTTFTISLPVVSDAPASPLPGRPAADVASGPGAILIVDADSANRQLLRRLLADLERPILATATADEALLVAERYGGAVDLTVIDVTTEGGRTLAGRLRESRPDVRVLLLAQDQPIDAGLTGVLLREPFELADVLTAARQLLEQKRSLEVL
jgi:CheY-like chemotaxis protein